MSILTKVLIGLVVVAVFPLVYFAAAALKVQQAWRSKVQAFEKAVVQQQEQNYALQHGDARARLERYVPGKPTNGTPGIDQYEAARDGLMLGRGRYWYAECVKDSIDPTNGKLKAEIKDENVESNPRQPLVAHGIKDKSFLYVFQLRHDGTSSSDDRYVGEFVVDGLTLDADGKPTDALVPLRPALPMDAAKWNALSSGSGVWVIYEHMPIDDHDVFNNLTEQEVRGSVPASVAAEYANDDKPPSDEVLSSDKLKQFIVEDPATGAKKFLRPLRDYQQIFRNVALRSAEIDDRLTILKKEKAFADQAKVQAEQLIANMDARIAKLNGEKQKLDGELAVVRNLREKLTATLAQVEQDLQNRLAENRRLADELAGRSKTAALFEPAGTAARTP
jgi:hypothetical protein